MKQLQVIYLFLCIYIVVDSGHSQKSANVLVVSVSLSRTNQIWNNAIATGLSHKGHNVTMLTPYVQSTQQPNEQITYIILEGALEKFTLIQTKKPYTFSDQDGKDEIEQLDMNELKSIARNHWDEARTTCNYYLGTSGLNQLLSYPAYLKFDVILWDMEYSDCLYPLICKFGNPPVVVLSPDGFQPSLNWIFGTHWETYLPLPGLPFDSNMDIIRRYLNAVTIKYMHYQKYRVYLKGNIDDAQKKFGNALEYEAALGLERNFTLALVNSNFNMDYGRDLSQNVILVGGLHLPKISKHEHVETKVGKRKREKKWIYVSIDEDKVELKKLQGMADCLGSLEEYDILWRCGTVSGLIRPKNVKFKQTFDQIKVLANAKTKLFVTSGNWLSLQEGLHFSVPMLAVPTSHKQTHNVQKLPIEVAAVVALKENYFCMKVRNILNDNDHLDSYLNYTRRIRDQPIEPLEKAIYWIEYAMRHGNGKHLEPLARRINYVNSENIDLLFYAAIGVLLPAYFCCAFVLKRLKRTFVYFCADGLTISSLKVKID